MWSTWTASGPAVSAEAGRVLTSEPERPGPGRAGSVVDGAGTPPSAAMASPSMATLRGEEGNDVGDLLAKKHQPELVGPDPARQ